MTQFPHDQFVKDYLPELLDDYGKATPGKKVSGEVKEVDVLFIPNQPVPTDTLGLLGKLAQTPCIFEVFRNPVTPEEIFSCAAKLSDLQGNKIKEIYNNPAIKETDSLRLWILTPTLSANTLASFGAVENLPEWGKGVYITPIGWKTGIVVIHQLEDTPETLWLRILGKGNVQAKAVQQLEELPTKDNRRENILELLYKLVTVLAINRRSGQIEQEDVELVNRISTLYLEKMQELAQLERQEGELSLVLRLLKRRVGEISPEIEARVKNLPISSLEALGEALLDFHTFDNLLDWLNNYDSSGT